MNNELLFNLLLPHLSLDVVYRLYPFSSILRRMVDNRFYWLKLIERDLKVVPQFKIDTKLHYLRLMNYPVGGWLMKRRIDEHTKSVTYKKMYPHKALQLVDKAILFSNNLIVLNNKNIRIKEPIKVVRRVWKVYYAIAYSGKVYNLSSEHPKRSLDIFGNNILDLSVMGKIVPVVSKTKIYMMIAMTHQGGLKLLTPDSNHTKMIRSLDLSEQLDSKAMQLLNQCVLTDKGTVYRLDPTYTNKINLFKENHILCPSPSDMGYMMGICIETKVIDKGCTIIYRIMEDIWDFRNLVKHLFIDPIGSYLLGNGFKIDLGERPILEVCDTRSSRIVLRTL